MHPIIEKYGKELTKELLDIMFIHQKVDRHKLRQAMINHGAIKSSTKIINGFINNGSLSHIFEPKDNTIPHNPVTNPRIMKRLSEPMKVYGINAYNGRNQKVLEVRVTENELEGLYKELYSEE